MKKDYQMKNKQSGFSLIELLLVIVIIGIIAAIAVPSLIRAREAAENGGAFSTMRTLSTLEVRYFSQKNRYGRLDEILSDQQFRLGTYDSSSKTLTRGSFSYEMSPLTMTDTELEREYKIVATRAASSTTLPYVLEVNHEGTITPIIP